jgi:hypothetical protein
MLFKNMVFSPFRSVLGSASVLALALAVGVPLVSACKTRTFQSGDASVKIKITNNDTGITEPFDVNDVSILIPFEMARTSREFAMSKFMTQEQLNDVLKVPEGAQMGTFSNSGSISPVQFSDPSQLIGNWRIVSLRVDTCAPGAHFAATLASGDQATRDRLCVIQIRLIAQPFPNNSEEDVTFHLLYNQPKNEESLKSLLVALDKVRKASQGKTKGAPLGIHPGLVDASTKQATLAAINDLLSATAAPDKLGSLAVMALASAGPEPWVFFAMSNAAGPNGKQLQLIKIPTVSTAVLSTENQTADKGSFQALSFITNEHVLGVPTNTPFRVEIGDNGVPSVKPIEAPMPVAIPNRSTKAILDAPGFDSVEIGVLDAAKMKILHEIDNPKPNAFFNMDCVSCHTTGNLMMRRLAFLGDAPTDPNLKNERDRIISGNTEGRFPIPKGVTGYINRAALPTQASFGNPWSVRNFGYFNSQATIGIRTATESAEVAEEINMENLGFAAAGPNSCNLRTPQEWKDIEPKLWTCMTFGPDSVQSCLSRFCSSEPPREGVEQQNGGVKVCSAPLSVVGLSPGSSLFVLSLDAANGERRSRAIMLDGGASGGFTKRLDFVHGKAGADVVRSTLDVRQDGADKITLRHRNSSGRDLFVVPNGGTIPLTWNCNRFEGKIQGAQVFVAASEEDFELAGSGQQQTIRPDRLPVEVPKDNAARRPSARPSPVRQLR